MPETTRSVRFLQAELTTRCNFTCGFCAGRSLPQRDMSLDVFRSAINMVADDGHVQLQGEGESLLHPRFRDFLEHMREARPSASATLITNGSLLTRESIGQILEGGLRRIDVSLETVDSEQFRDIRGGDFGQIRGNLVNLMRARRERPGPRPVIGLAVTVLKCTVPQVGAIGGFYEDLELDGGIVFQPLQRMDVYARNYGEAIRAQMLSPSDRRDIRARIAADDRLRRILRTAPAEPSFYVAMTRAWNGASRGARSLRLSGEEATEPCPWLARGLYVCANGTAVTCCYVKDSERHGLGACNSGDLESIFRGRDRLRSSLATGRVPDQCAGCGYAAARG